jgi:hypothetical protein
MRLRGPDGRSDDKERFAVVICADRDPLTWYRGTQTNIHLFIKCPKFFLLITTVSGFYQSCCPEGDLSWQRQVFLQESL